MELAIEDAHEQVVVLVLDQARAGVPSRTGR